MKFILHQSLLLRSIAIGVISFLVFSCSTATHDLTTIIKDSTIDDINGFFESQNKNVVTFVGYSGVEYEDKAAMLEKAGHILDKFDPSKTVVNIGATPEGIGAVYELAKRRGFTTTGIVSTQAKKYNAELSPYVDYVFYVEDAVWGGFILSPTSSAMVANSDVLVGIGGGEIARDELVAAKRSGKRVRFIPADMNHQKAKEKAQKKGIPTPTHFGGAASELFNHQ